MARLARSLGGLSVLAIMLLATAGCATYARHQESAVGFYYPHARSETLSMSPHEHYHKVSQISAHDTRALFEDLDLLFMTDRNTRLTRWHDR